LKKVHVFFLLGLLLFIAFPGYSYVSNSEVDKYNTYQWHGREGEGWFEWWYFKLIDPQTKTPFYFVYGVVNPWDTKGTNPASRAFVNFGNFSTHTQITQNFKVGEFEARKDITFVRIGQNIATDKQMIGRISDEKGNVASWNLKIKKVRGWNAMGWGLSSKLFNVWWYPAQMDAKVSGTIEMNGQVFKIENADGYQDRNWGTSFPKWWYWLVSNSFRENKKSSLVSGGGFAATRNGNRLPTAILLGLYHEGEMYEFRSSDFGNLIDYDFQMGQWDITAVKPGFKIKVHATCEPEELMDLVFVTPQGESFHDYETLTGSLTVELFKRELFGWKKMTTLHSDDQTGLELGLDHEYDGAFRVSGTIDNN